MVLPIALFLSVTLADTGKVMSITSQMRFESIDRCENFILRMSKDYPYYRNDEGSLILTDPRTGNVITATCYEK